MSERSSYGPPPPRRRGGDIKGDSAEVTIASERELYGARLAPAPAPAHPSVRPTTPTGRRFEPPLPGLTYEQASVLLAVPSDWLARWDAVARRWWTIARGNSQATSHIASIYVYFAEIKRRVEAAVYDAYAAVLPLIERAYGIAGADDATAVGDQGAGLRAVHAGDHHTDDDDDPRPPRRFLTTRNG